MNKKNKFAMELMDVFNEEYLSRQHGSPEIDVIKDHGSVGNPLYNSKGEVMFEDSDENTVSASELFEWYNIVMNDPENTFDITDEMKIWLGKAIENGYITSKTKTEW